MGRLYDALPDSFIKKALKDENPELVENLLNCKMMYEKEQDKDKKVVFRDRLSSAFSNLYLQICMKLTDNSAKEKRMLVRYGLLDLKYLSAEEQKLILDPVNDEKDPEGTFLYVDEWIIEVLKGKIKPSTTDEASPRNKAEKGADNSSQIKMERISGTLEAERRNFSAAIEKRKIIEDALLSLVNMITSHSVDPVIGFPEPYSDDQLAKIDELTESTREMKKIDREMRNTRNSYYERYEEYKTLESEVSEAGGGVNAGSTTYAVDSRTAESEVSSVRQMQKMCTGRQGNHFPILIGSFMPKETREYNFKMNAFKRLKEIESLDPSIFDRTFRQNSARIPPYILLVPGYGNYGICWEPYDKYNKASSKGRMAIPIFCRNPKFTMSVGLGDFRWQVAKEMAGYHWMDEGLTGRYYEYVTSSKLKGDIKTLFINDYILWITKEAEGIQKLESQNARFIFWRFVPFPDKIKEELANRGYYYNDLYKKELSFRMTSGKA